MTRYVDCDICHASTPDDFAHMPHDPGCDQFGCACDNYVCPLCCGECNAPPKVIPGQVSLLPEASTTRLPKRVSS